LKDTQEDGVPLVVVILPGRPQTTSDFAALTDLLYGHTPEGALFREDPNRPQRIMLDWAMARSVPALDVLRALQQAAESGSVNLADGHFNAHGNQVIAQEIFAFVEESGILK
jgi:hypothetical protein